MYECKTTLKAEHLEKAVKTSSEIKSNLQKKIGSPYKELNSSIIYGLLAHSHSWKSENSKPIENIEHALWEADIKYVTHPIQCLDYITVSDLATWRTAKLTFIGPKDPYYNSEFEKIYGKDGSGVSSYICSAIGSDRQDNYFFRNLHGNIVTCGN
jgi:hypothetical protein